MVLVNSLRIKSIAQEKWLYGQTMCYLNPFFVRYFYINTVLHLVAVSYDRYLAIVKSPLTYGLYIIIACWLVFRVFQVDEGKREASEERLTRLTYERWRKKTTYNKYNLKSKTRQNGFEMTL